MENEPESMKRALRVDPDTLRTAADLLEDVLNDATAQDGGLAGAILNRAVIRGYRLAINVLRGTADRAFPGTEHMQ